MWYIEHSAKGTIWKKHKYIKKIGDQYIYAKEKIEDVVSPIKDKITSIYEKGAIEISKALKNIGKNEKKGKAYEHYGDAEWFGRQLEKANMSWDDIYIYKKEVKFQNDNRTF